MPISVQCNEFMLTLEMGCKVIASKSEKILTNEGNDFAKASKYRSLRICTDLQEIHKQEVGD